MAAWLDNRRFLLLLYFILLLLPIAFIPLAETTEARYSEIAREMVASGNYLEPTFNGIKHFHKPPLAYWLIAAGLNIFGQNDFGARFFGVVSAVIAVAALFHLGRVILADEEKAFMAALIGASSLLFLAVARIAATDIYLTCFTLLAQVFLFRQIYGRKSPVNALLYASFLALGFLTKGPIIFLFTLLPYLLAKIFDREHRQVFSGKEIIAAAFLFSTIALPWYLAASAKNPGLLQYFLQVQTVDRVVTDRFHRYEPPWYFLEIFALTFLPYIFFFLRGAAQPRALPARTRILLVYISVPFLVFSLAQGKHPTYILPLFGAAALLTAETISRFPSPRLKWLALAVLLPLALVPAAAAFFWPPLAGQGMAVAAFTPVALLLFRQVVRERDQAGFVPWTAVLLVVVAAAGMTVQAMADTQFKGYERMTAAIDRLDPQHHLPVIVFNSFLPSISFYRRDLAVMALGRAREVQFERGEDYRQTYLPEESELTAFLQGREKVFVILKPDALPQLHAIAPSFACTEFFAQRKHTAYLCENR